MGGTCNTDGEMRNEYKLLVCKSRETVERERPRLIDARLISKSILEKSSLKTELA
jgi:hypothetical protein